MTAARWYTVFTAGVAAFIIFGSLVPFHFQSRPIDRAWHDFVWVLQTRLRVESRSDLIANVLLGVPLGFFLLGTRRIDQPGRMATLRVAFILLPVCVVFAAAVEFVQLYFPGRTCSTTDILAQGAGAAFGMAGWMLLGQRVTDTARRVLADPRSGGTAGRILVGYLGLLVLAQMMPLDFSASPYMARRRLTCGDVTLIPFAEWSAPESNHGWLIFTWLGSVALFLPAGWLLARLPVQFWRRWTSFPVVAGIGLGLALTTEVAQILVSRYPSTTDGLAGGLGFVIGWAIRVGKRSLRQKSAHLSQIARNRSRANSV